MKTGSRPQYCRIRRMVQMVRSVPDTIAESLEGDGTIETERLSAYVGVLSEDGVRIDPEVWPQRAGCVELREAIRATYQTLDERYERAADGALAATATATNPTASTWPKGALSWRCCRFAIRWNRSRRCGWRPSAGARSGCAS